MICQPIHHFHPFRVADCLFELLFQTAAYVAFAMLGPFGLAEIQVRLKHFMEHPQKCRITGGRLLPESPAPSYIFPENVNRCIMLQIPTGPLERAGAHQEAPWVCGVIRQMQ